MFRRVIALAVGLVLLTPSLGAAATPTPGKLCPKLGKTIIAAKKKYTCIKSGKKIVWSKGVPVASKPPTTNPVTIPVFTPTVPTSFDDLVANYQGISYAAWSNAKTKILSSSSAVNQITLDLGPTSKLTYTDPGTAFKLVSRLYFGYANPEETIILAFNFADKEWAQSEIDRLVPSAKASRWIDDIACRTAATCWGGGVFTEDGKTIVVVLTVGKFDANHTEGTVEAHEYTHAIALSQMKALNPWPMRDPWPPTWFWEGQAQFTQNAAIFHQSFGMYTKRRGEASSDLFRDSSYSAEFIKEYFEVNAPDSWRTKYEGWRQYDLGAMFIEILVALKGPDSLMQLWSNAHAGMGFADSFKETYGIAFDKALPIMAEAIALELGHARS